MRLNREKREKAEQKDQHPEEMRERTNAQTSTAVEEKRETVTKLATIPREKPEKLTNPQMNVPREENEGSKTSEVATTGLRISSRTEARKNDIISANEYVGLQAGIGKRDGYSLKEKAINVKNPVDSQRKNII